MALETEGTGAQAPDFLTLLQTHKHVDDLFLLHQEALLDQDVPLAARRLEAFERAFLRHMRAEEELLFPIYVAYGPHVRAPLMLFQFEHRKMQELLAGFKERLAAIERSGGALKRPIIRLMDAERTFKHLSEHHGEREERFLYPALNLATGVEERRSLLARCEAWEE